MTIFNALEKYSPTKSDYVTARKNLLINGKNVYDGRGIFSLNPEEGLFEDAAEI